MLKKSRVLLKRFEKPQQGKCRLTWLCNNTVWVCVSTALYWAHHWEWCILSV